MAQPHKIEPKGYEDLRLTVVMNGGVSLAIWIGGVAQEIHRLQEGDSFYAQLTDFVATRAHVDVISGTSAGGINGAFLAIARVFGTDLRSLRNVWLQSGSLDHLLRDPKQKDPSSLLNGTYFSDELLKALNRLTGPTARSNEEASIDLILTTTLLHGLPNQLADDFGAPINEADHRASFRFRRGPDLVVDDFADPLLTRRLAVAARATASFPLAFEPVFCRPAPLEGGPGLRMDSVSSFRADRYLLDGGILDNKPLDYALNSLAHMRVKGMGRRVICYVVPSLGESASSDPDDPGKPPAVAEVAIASASTLPMTQSIAAQINQIKEHNHEVRQLRQTRLALASLKWESVQTSASHLFETYQRRRADSAAVFITEQVVSSVALADPRQGIGRRRREWIAGLFLAIFKKQGLPWVPQAIPLEDAERQDLDLDHWHWGLFTVENIANMTLDVLGRGSRLTAFNASDNEEAEKLNQIRKSANALLVRLVSLRAAGGIFWNKRAATFPQPFGNLAGVERWALESVQTYPSSAEYGEIAFSFAQLLSDAAVHLRSVASGAKRRNRWVAETEAAMDLRQIVDLLAPEGLSPAAILVRLLKVEVVQFAVGFSGRARDVADEVLELVEICADNSAFLGLNAVRGRKPAGAVLANFGGFYKKSWRANDWMLGRLQGAERLVSIVLNPERIRRLYFGQDPDRVCELLRTIAVPPPGDPDEQGCAKWWEQRAPLIGKELAFLKDPDELLPEQLVHAADAVLYRFQLAILREELPLLASAIEDDVQAGHGPGKGGAFLNQLRGITANQGYSALRQVPSDVIENLYGSCIVDQETISEESASDRFTATVTRASAVSVSMLAGMNSGVPGVGRIVSIIRLPILLTDMISQSLLQRSGVSVFLYAAVIGASAAILLLAFYPTAHVPWLILAIASIVLVFSVGLFSGTARYRLALLVLLFLILTCAFSPEVRHTISNLWVSLKSHVVLAPRTGQAAR